jgi:TRAP-type C4-dicarboxylate transport system permease small subunit
MMQNIDRYLRRIIVFLVCLQGLVIVVLIGTEVFFRYVVGRALSWPEEVIGLIFVWFTLLGVVLLTQSGEHIEFSFLLNRFGPRVGKVFAIFIQVLIALFSLLMIVYGSSYAMMFRFENTPAVGINALWLYLSLPICGLLIFFYSQLNILKILKSSDKNGRQL